MKTIKRCRSCGHPGLLPVLDMGEQPLSNGLRNQDQLKDFKAVYPLTLVYCELCSLVQIMETVDPEKLFSDYLYFSSQSATMVASAKELVERMIKYRPLNKDSLAMEAASNDGYLLQFYRDNGIPHIGVDPAQNIAEMANGKGIRTDPDFFTATYADKWRGQVDVFHANNVLGHVLDQNDFVAGIAKVLKNTGVAIIEVPYVAKMIDNVEFDTIYHEHLCYFSITSLQILFKRHGLSIFDVEKLDIHGGSIRVYVTKDMFKSHSSFINSMIDVEMKNGMTEYEYYRKFEGDVARLGQNVFRKLYDLEKRDYKYLAGYGAAAKANVFLNYFKIDESVIDFIVDSTPAKIGKYMSGADIRIVSPAELTQRHPQAIVIFAWNFAQEIMSKHKAYDGKWITFLPKIQEY